MGQLVDAVLAKRRIRMQEEQLRKQEEARQQFAQLLGQTPQTYQPGTGMPPIEPQAGTGYLGGKMGEQEFATRLLGVPGYEQMGLQLLGQGMKERLALSEMQKRDMPYKLETGYMPVDPSRPEMGVMPVPGSKTEREISQQLEKSASREEQRKARAEIVSSKVDDALKMVDFGTTGFTGGMLKNIPGTDAYNLDKTVDTIKSILSFDELSNMRANSPTGGALGSVAVRELELLGSTIASLEVGQDADIIKKNLQAIKSHYDKWRSAVDEAQKGGAKGPWSKY